MANSIDMYQESKPIGKWWYYMVGAAAVVALLGAAASFVKPFSK